MEEESCEKCREWEEHHYWDHVDAKGKLFYRVMMDDFTHSMRIPKKFIDHMSGELTEVVHLKDPSGFIWQAELIKNMDDAYLQSGWKDFAEAHHLEENNLLIFEYVGKSCFEIKILEESGCEKAHSYCLEIKNLLKQERSDHSIDILNATPSTKAIMSSSSGNSHVDILHKQTSSAPQKICRNRKEENINQSIRLRRSTRITRNNELGDQAENMKAKTSKNVEARKDAKYHRKQKYADMNDCEELNDSPICMSRKLSLTVAEEAAVKRLVRTVSPGNPYFVHVMRPSNVSKNSYLTVPSSFRTHLPSEECLIKLQVAGRRGKWSVKYVCWKTTSGFYKNWNRFVFDNSLQEGDVCLFELFKSHRENIEMKVKISHAADEDHDVKESDCFF